MNFSDLENDFNCFIKKQIRRDTLSFKENGGDEYYYVITYLDKEQSVLRENFTPLDEYNVCFATTKLESFNRDYLMDKVLKEE